MGKLCLKQAEMWIQVCNDIIFDGMEVLKLGNVNAHFFCDISDSNLYRQAGWKAFLKRFIEIFVKREIYYFSPKNNKIVLFRSPVWSHRKSLIEQCERVAKCHRNVEIASADCLFSLACFPNHCSLCFYSLGIKTLLRYGFLWWKSLRKLPIKLQYKIQLLPRLILQYCWYQTLLNHKDTIGKFKAVIVNYDLHEPLTILVQFCQHESIPTATLQHGFFPDNAPGYRFAVSDYFFAWGQYAKDQALDAGMSEERIIVVGAPQYIDVTPLSKKRITRCFGVVLGAPDFLMKKFNCKLLRIAREIARRMSFKFIVRLHPDSIAQLYKEEIDTEFFVGFCERSSTVRDFAGKIDFAICMPSTVYAELTFLGIPSFRFVSDGLQDLYWRIPDGSFADSVDLMKWMNIYRETPQKIYEMQMRQRNYLFAEGDFKENYHQALEKIMSLHKAIAYDVTDVS